MRFSLLILGVIFAVVVFQSTLVSSRFGFRRGGRVSPGGGSSIGKGSSRGTWNKGGSGSSGGTWNKGSSGSSGNWNKGSSSGSGTSGNKWGKGSSGSGTSGSSGNSRWGKGDSSGSGTSGSSRWEKGGSSGSSRWEKGGSSGGNSRWGNKGSGTGSTGNKGSGAGSTGSGSGSSGTGISKWSNAKTKLTAADRFKSTGKDTGGLSGMTPKQKWGSAAERAQGPKSAWPDVVKQAKAKNANKVAAKDRVKGFAKNVGNIILEATIESLVSEAINAGFKAALGTAKAKGQSTTGVVPTPSCSEADKTVYTKVGLYHLSDNCTGKGASMSEDEKTKFLMAAIVQMCADPKSAVPNCGDKAKPKPDEGGKPAPTNPPPVTCADADMFRNLAIYQMGDNCDGTGKKYTKAKYDQEVTNSITYLCKNPDNAFPNCPAKCPQEKTWEGLGRFQLSDKCKGTGKNMKPTNFALTIMKLIDKMCAANPNPDNVQPDCST